MLSIIQAIKLKFIDFCFFYFGELGELGEEFYVPGVFNYPLRQDHISVDNFRNKIVFVEEEKKTMLRMIDEGDYDYLFSTDYHHHPRNVVEITININVAHSYHITLGAIFQAFNAIFSRLDYGNYLTDGPPPESTEEKLVFVWDTVTSNVKPAQAGPEFGQLYVNKMFDFYTSSIVLEPGYYGINWFGSILKAIPGVIFKVYKESQIVTLLIFDPLLKLKLNERVGQLLGLPQDELQSIVVYKGKYDIDSIKYLFIHCEQLDPNYNFYDGKSSTVLGTRDTDLCNLEVNPTCKRLVDRNIDELTFSLKNDKGRLVTGEGDGILLEVNIV